MGRCFLIAMLGIWDITDDWHFGSAFTWTKWSNFSQLNFNLGGMTTPVELNWVDTYRIAVAPSWDFARDWTWMASYAYETDCTGEQDSTKSFAARTTGADGNGPKYRAPSSRTIRQQVKRGHSADGSALSAR